MKVIKVDETQQSWNFEKIVKAVSKSFPADKQPDDKFIEQLSHEFDSFIDKDVDITTEQINDIIQKFLIKKNKYEVVEDFINWRKKKEEAREKKSPLIKRINKALNASDIQNQNANVDEASFGGRIGEAARVVCKDTALKMMNRQSRLNHENNEVYEHDLDSYAAGMHNCLSDPLDDQLGKGFKTRQCDVRPANSLNTAFQLVAVSFQVQSLQQFGGISGTHLDWTMVPYYRSSFYKHYNHVRDILPFLKPLNIENPKQVSVLDEVYKGKHWWNFVKRYCYYKAKKFTNKELCQAAEGMYHNLNTLQSRSGNQLPFSSINFGTCTLPEGRAVTRALINKCIDGVGKNHTTSIFPCVIFQYKKGINDKPGTPNYDLKRLAIKSLSRRIYPNFANCDWSNQKAWKEYDNSCKQEVINELSEKEITKLNDIISKDNELAYKLALIPTIEGVPVIDTTERPTEMFSTMGCRTANGGDVNFIDSYRQNIKSVLETGKLKNDFYSAAQKDGRGNICPVTVIMPTLAMEVLEKKYKGITTDYNEMITMAHKDPEIVDQFIKYLDKKIGEAKDMLLERFEHIISQPAASAKFMWDNHTMAGYVEEEGTVSAIKHGTLAIGQIALAETLEILIGTNHVHAEGMELAKRIEQLFSDRCNDYKKEYKLNFGVYYTPAENLCRTALNNFRKKYGRIEKVSDRDYFTNSMHVPVWENVNAFEKIDIESQLTGYSSAGCITYVELPDGTMHNIDGLEEIVDYAMDHDIPYFAINIPLDTCQDCGYTGEFDVCPICGSKRIKRLRRITGYLTSSVEHFNPGKRAEEGDRIKHMMKIICEYCQ